MKPRPRVKRVDKHGNSVRVGDRIRVTGIHSKVRDTKEFKTRTILKRCVGRVFPIYGFQKDWVELHLGHVVGRRSWEEHIWVEPEFVELVGKKKPKMGRVKQSAGFRRVLK